jgi:hypothetical protein
MASWGRAAVVLSGVVAALLLGGCGHDWDGLEPLGSAGGQGGGASQGSGGMGGSSSSTGGAGGASNPMEIEYTATIAECMSPVNPDPAGCELATGFGTMNVDESDSATGEPNYAFVRFDIDAWLADETIDAVTLRLVAADTAKAEGPNSGEVRQVEPFVYDDLLMGAPQSIQLLSGDVGRVVQGQIVEWDLSVIIVSAGAVICLGVVPQSSDGVDYWNLNGITPPRLIVAYR